MGGAVPYLRGLLALLVLVVVALPTVSSPAELLTVLVGASVLILLVVWQEPARSAPPVQVRVLRERAERLAFLRTRDPDADGRVRPRAPGQCSAAV
jgi:hypothetical protein